jgi:carbonic anhydrase/acetyltransferase-like protein (isoleucine patch superfamily)
MQVFDYAGYSPILSRNCWVAHNAILLGDVRLECRASVWFGAVLRGDQGAIHVGIGSNVQDLCVLHSNPGQMVRIGQRCSIGHRAVLHGCTIGDYSLIGIGAIILDGATIGRNCIVGAGSVITSGMNIPDNSMVVGVPGRIVRKLGERNVKIQRRQSLAYERIWRSIIAGSQQDDIKEWAA